MSISRSRFEIFKELLTQVHNGSYQPTRLMHSTNTSFGDLNLYKETLISLGLLMEIEESADNRVGPGFTSRRRVRGSSSILNRRQIQLIW